VEGTIGEPQTKMNAATGNRAATAKGDIKMAPGSRILITERGGLFNSKQPSRAPQTLQPLRMIDFRHVGCGETRNEWKSE
jgi:hypothetical protein